MANIKVQLTRTSTGTHVCLITKKNNPLYQLRLESDDVEDIGQFMNVILKGREIKAHHNDTYIGTYTSATHTNI